MQRNQQTPTPPPPHGGRHGLINRVNATIDSVGSLADMRMDDLAYRPGGLSPTFGRFEIVRDTTTSVRVYLGIWTRKGIPLTLDMANGDNSTYESITGLSAASELYYIILTLTRDDAQKDPALVPNKLVATAETALPADTNGNIVWLLGFIPTNGDSVLGTPTQTWLGDIDNEVTIPDGETNVAGEIRSTINYRPADDGTHEKELQLSGADGLDDTTKWIPSLTLSAGAGALAWVFPDGSEDPGTADQFSIEILSNELQLKDFDNPPAFTVDDADLLVVRDDDANAVKYLTHDNAETWLRPPVDVLSIEYNDSAPSLNEGELQLLNWHAPVEGSPDLDDYIVYRPWSNPADPSIHVELRYLDFEGLRDLIGDSHHSLFRWTAGDDTGDGWTEFDDHGGAARVDGSTEDNPGPYVLMLLGASGTYARNYGPSVMGETLTIEDALHVDLIKDESESATYISLSGGTPQLTGGTNEDWTVVNGHKLLVADVNAYAGANTAALQISGGFEFDDRSYGTDGTDIVDLLTGTEAGLFTGAGGHTASLGTSTEAGLFTGDNAHTVSLGRTDEAAHIEHGSDVIDILDDLSSFLFVVTKGGGTITGIEDGTHGLYSTGKIRTDAAFNFNGTDGVTLDDITAIFAGGAFVNTAGYSVVGIRAQPSGGGIPIDVNVVGRVT